MNPRYCECGHISTLHNAFECEGCVACDGYVEERRFIPRALRCACTDAHHYRGSTLCPLTPVDPWASSTSHNTTSTEE